MNRRGPQLDRYVRRIFLTALAGCLTIFTVLWMVGDFFGKVRYILEAIHEDPEHNTIGAIALLVGRYFLANLPFFLHHTAAFIPLIAALYTVNRLLHTNELVPIVAAGRSLFRALRPLVTWTAGFAILVFLNQEVLLPRFTLDQKHLGRQIKGRSGRELTGLPIIADDYGNRFILDRYDPHPRHRLITGLVVIKTVAAGPRRIVLEREVVASTARFAPRTKQRGKGWVLGPGSYEVVRDATGRLVRRPLGFLGDTHLRPRHIEHAELDKPALSLRELRRKNRNVRDPAVSLEIQRHFTHPLKCLLLLFLGLPFLMRAYRRQMTLAPLLRCLASAAAFYLFDFLCLSLGHRGTLGPAVAAWLPFVLFAAVAAVLLDKVRT